ncbi:MAG: DUF6353 family protein [Endomicrobium sp.]|jgi:hypothetical protein|uniref:DUF6353 family protein n=1 Tax=Candidatus Endomicrobiellum cubanum TaxID=3242325 RepID=UPI0028336C37|nr:DUF6353 family protein [Endomicrobium sp.]
MFEIVKTASRRAWLKVQEKSPEIFLTLGIGSFIGSTVLACKATLKSQVVVKKHKDRLITINDAELLAKDNPSDPDYHYTDDMKKKDIAISYGLLVREYIKLFGPAFGMSLIGIAFVIKSRNILHNRNIALIAAYNVLAKGFEMYRKRVTDELGSDMDYHFRYGTKLDKIVETTVDEDGKKKKVEVVKQTLDSQELTGEVYSRIFDERILNWSSQDDYNWMFLKAKEELFNFNLMKDKVVFLNDVYKELGFPTTKAGQTVGWTTKGNGDGIIDFNMHFIDYPGSEIRRKARPILIEFNVDGPVLNAIDVEI